MILQRYMDRNWLENSFCLWIQKCNDAVNAESIELLNEVTERLDSVVVYMCSMLLTVFDLCVGT